MLQYGDSWYWATKPYCLFIVKQEVASCHFYKTQLHIVAPCKRWLRAYPHPVAWPQSDHAPLLHPILMATVINKGLILSNARTHFCEARSSCCIFWLMQQFLCRVLRCHSHLQKFTKFQLGIVYYSCICINLVLASRLQQCYSFLWEKLFDFFIPVFIYYIMKSATGILYKHLIQQVCAKFGTWLIIILCGWVNQNCAVQDSAVWRVAFIHNIQRYFTLLSHALSSLQQRETVLTSH